MLHKQDDLIRDYCLVSVWWMVEDDPCQQLNLVIFCVQAQVCHTQVYTRQHKKVVNLKTEFNEMGKVGHLTILVHLFTQCRVGWKYHENFWEHMLILYLDTWLHPALYWPPHCHMCQQHNNSVNIKAMMKLFWICKI